MKLQKMKYIIDGCTHKVICAVDITSHGGEYTVCGVAIPDTTIENDECCHIGEEFEGKLKNVTCPLCLKTIRIFQSFN